MYPLTMCDLVSHASGVARAELGGQAFLSVVTPCGEGMMTPGALERPRCHGLLRMSGDDGGVQTDDHGLAQISVGDLRGRDAAVALPDQVPHMHAGLRPRHGD